ncbi:MAG: hypothetical protein QXX84_09040, partial [Sulfolobales archaeon]
CFICGVNEGVRRLEFSDSFVTYGDVFSGGMACDVCYMLVKDQRYRRSSWILVGGEVRILDKSQLLDAILKAPPGSLVYVKSRGQKLAYLRSLRFRSTVGYIVVCGEDEGLIVERRSKVLEYAGRLSKLVSLGFRKSDLLNGCSVEVWRYRDECEYVEKVRGDPLWRVMVRAV